MAKVATVFVALAAAAAAAEAADATSCDVGIPLRGFGNALDGDYMGGGIYDTTGWDRNMLMFQAEGKSDDPRQDPCEGSHMHCTKRERALVNGKWGIWAYSRPLGGDLLLAVCNSGCPDGSWPQSWKQPMEWSVLNTSNAELKQPYHADVTGSCCKRKPQYCDACGDATCQGLTTGWPPLGVDKCPGSLLSKIPFLLTHMQKDCCTSGQTPIGNRICQCKSRVTVCETSDVDEITV